MSADRSSGEEPYVVSEERLVEIRGLLDWRHGGGPTMPGVPVVDYLEGAIEDLLAERDGHGPLYARLMEEIARQDEKHGPFYGGVLARSRVALACLEDEVDEAKEAWRDERGALTWERTREEVLQVAAVAIRALRDAL